MRELLRQAARCLYAALLPPRSRSSLRMLFVLEEPDRHPQLIASLPERRVLVLAPHVDDEVAGCGGAIRRHALAGAEVTVVYLTDGRRGDPDLYRRGLSPAETARAEEAQIAVRKQEAARSAEILGVRKSRFLDARDGELEPAPPIVGAVREILLELHPDLVYLPSFMDLHADHWATNRVFHAALSGRPSPADGTWRVRGYEVWSPLVANRILDIGEVIEDKRRALEQFESQNAHIDYVRALTGLNAYRSIYFLRGRGHAEAFFECTPEAYRSIFERLTRRR